MNDSILTKILGQEKMKSLDKKYGTEGVKYIQHTQKRRNTKNLCGSAQGLRPWKREKIHYKMNNRIYNVRWQKNTQNLHHYPNPISR